MRIQKYEEFLNENSSVQIYETEPQDVMFGWDDDDIQASSLTLIEKCKKNKVGIGIKTWSGPGGGWPELYFIGQQEDIIKACYEIGLDGEESEDPKWEGCFELGDGTYTDKPVYNFSPIKIFKSVIIQDSVYMPSKGHFLRLTFSKIENALKIAQDNDINFVITEWSDGAFIIITEKDNLLLFQRYIYDLEGYDNTIVVKILIDHWKEISSQTFQRIYNKLTPELQKDLRKYKVLNQHKNVI